MFHDPAISRVALPTPGAPAAPAAPDAGRRRALAVGGGLLALAVLGLLAWAVLG